MAVGETHHDRCLARTVGVDITLGPRAEADTVEVAAAADIIVGVVVGVVIVMEAAEEGPATLLYIRAATILVSTMADIARAVEAHREDAVGVEATKVSFEHGQFYYYSLALFVFAYDSCVIFETEILCSTCNLTSSPTRLCDFKSTSYMVFRSLIFVNKKNTSILNLSD
jgi:hypothetical protein